MCNNIRDHASSLRNIFNYRVRDRRKIVTYDFQLKVLNTSRLYSTLSDDYFISLFHSRSNSGHIEKTHVRTLFFFFFLFLIQLQFATVITKWEGGRKSDRPSGESLDSYYRVSFRQFILIEQIRGINCHQYPDPGLLDGVFFFLFLHLLR